MGTVISLSPAEGDKFLMGGWYADLLFEHVRDQTTDSTVLKRLDEAEAFQHLDISDRESGSISVATALQEAIPSAIEELLQSTDIRDQEFIQMLRTMLLTIDSIFNNPE